MSDLQCTAEAPATKLAPVIAFDGPSGSGKGTIACSVAKKLGFLYLDSGALYRLVALASLNQKIAIDDTEMLIHVAKTTNIVFQGNACSGSDILLGGRVVNRELRLEEVGYRASRIATIPSLRNALLDRQLRWRRMPGLVADGRDMGTVVFPDATLKIYLTASVQIRAERRHNQLIEKGVEISFADLLADIEERDERDHNRSIAPLVIAEDAVKIDSSSLTIDEVVATVLDLLKLKQEYFHGEEFGRKILQ